MARVSLKANFEGPINKIFTNNAITLAKQKTLMLNKFCIKLPKLLEDNLNFIFDNNNFNPLKSKSEILEMVRHIDRRQTVIENKDLKSKILKFTTNFDIDKNEDCFKQNEHERIKKRIIGKLKKDIYNWHPLKFSERSVLHYAAGKLASNYATIYQIFNEIFVEQGTTSSYNLIMEVRDYILKKGKRKLTMVCHETNTASVPTVFAPCLHDKACPRPDSATLSKTPCSFRVRYQPLKVMEPKVSNAFAESYSYVVFEMRPPNDDGQSGNGIGGFCETGYDLARVVAPPLVRHRHVHCQLCTRGGSLKKIVATNYQNGRDLYHFAKHCQVGDLFPKPVVEEAENENFLENAVDLPTPHQNPHFDTTTAL